MRTREGICVGMGQGGQLGSKRGNVKLAWLIRLRLYGEYSSGITRGKGVNRSFRRCAVFRQSLKILHIASRKEPFHCLRNKS